MCVPALGKLKEIPSLNSVSMGNVFYLFLQVPDDFGIRPDGTMCVRDRTAFGAAS